jgi:YHS domain-containing protein
MNKLTSGTLLLLFFSICAMAQVDPIDKKTRVAVGGYDLVSYFKDIKPRQGVPEYSEKRNGIVYRFANEENRKLFVREPEKYLPQYDGYCALAVAQSRKVSINPAAYKITNGKLYLFFNGPLPFKREIFNSLDSWLKDEPGLIKKANDNWPMVKNKKF